MHWGRGHLGNLTSVDSRVLIPRPETEILVDVAHDYLGECDQDALGSAT